MDLLDRLLGHDRWATTQLLELSRSLNEEQLDQPFDIGLGSLRETFDHMIFVIDFWTARMAEQPVEDNRTTQQYDRSIPVLTQRHERFQARYASFARQAQDNSRLEDTYLDHYQYRQTVGGTIIQVIHHNAEHRAEILHILNRLGVPAIPEVDPQIWEHKTGII